VHFAANRRPRAAPPHISAALLELGDDSLQAIERQIVANRQHQGQRFGEPVAPVAVDEAMLDIGLADLQIGNARISGSFKIEARGGACVLETAIALVKYRRR
jgi:hypothetical protein